MASPVKDSTTHSQVRAVFEFQSSKVILSSKGKNLINYNKTHKWTDLIKVAVAFKDMPSHKGEQTWF